MGKQTHPIHSCRSLPACLSVCADSHSSCLAGGQSDEIKERRKNREVSHQRCLSSLVAQILLLVWQKLTAPMVHSSFFYYSQHLFPCNTFMHAFILLYGHTFFLFVHTKYFWTAICQRKVMYTIIIFIKSFACVFYLFEIQAFSSWRHPLESVSMHS